MTNKITVFAFIGMGLAAFGGLIPEQSRKLMVLTGLSVPSQAAETQAPKDEAPAKDAHGHAQGGGEESGEEGGIHLSDEQVKAARIEVAPAAAGTLSRSVTVPGTVSANADRLVHVAAKVPGTLKEIRKRLGEAVKEGELIATMESRDIAEAKSEYLASMRSEQLARTTYEREKSLWQKRISAQQDYLEAGARAEEARIRVDLARQKLETLGLQEAEITRLAKPPTDDLRILEVRAPIGGRIIERKPGLGALIEANADIFIVADLSSVWVEMTVPPGDLPFVKEGQKITVVNAAGNKTDGEVIFVNPVIDADTRSARVVAQVANADQMWRPGEYVTARLHTDTQPAAIVIPRDAVQKIGDEAVVFVRNKEGFEKREIVLGRLDEEIVEVVFGLDPGEVLAVSNTFVLKAELGKSEAAHSHAH